MAEVLRGIPLDYEPLRENRFFLEFPTELGIDVWKVQTADAPKVEQTSVEIPFFNTTDYVIGKYKWNPQSLTLIDTIGLSTSQEIMEWERLHSESITGRQGYAIGYKKDLVLKLCDPTGVEVQKWLLEKTQILDIDFGSLNYDGDAVKMIDMTIQPFRCILLY